MTAPTPADLAALAEEAKRALVHYGHTWMRKDREATEAAIDALLAAATREPPAPPEGKLEQAVATQRQPIVPEGWKLTHIQEREAGLVDIGHRDEDGVFYDVVTVDTANYFQPEAAMPIARAIVAALAAPVASERDSMVPSPSAQPYGWVIDGELVTEGNAYPADLERFKRLGTPVYLAQPAELKERKPLTDMEALSLVKSPPRTWGGVLALTRAIERAHGIQEQPKESK
jgi:hypothetical protein